MSQDGLRELAMEGQPLGWNIIDLWDVGTFDPEVLAFLHGNADLVRCYEETERAIFLEYDYGPGRATFLPRPASPFAAAHPRLGEAVAEHMRARMIRAYHYTRMTDGEVAAMRRGGIHLSTPGTLRRRLDALVMDNLLTAFEADAVARASPFHGQLDIRADRFWLTSHPHTVDDPGVTLLLQHWGGEAAYMWLKDEPLVARIQAVGQPRIIELAVPLNRTAASDRAGESALATFARSLGCATAQHAIDVCVTAPLPPEAVLAVHTEGEEAFGLMGRGYPAGYVDVSLTYWQELTGGDG